MAFASQQPLQPSEKPPQRTLVETLDHLKEGVKRQSRRFYNRPIPANAKAAMHRLMGEKAD